MKIYSFCITFTPTAYATNDTTIIHLIYKPDFVACVTFSTTGSWDLFAIKSAAVFGLVFFQVNGHNVIYIVSRKIFDNKKNR